jgi:hypothetical protein
VLQQRVNSFCSVPLGHTDLSSASPKWNCGLLPGEPALPRFSATPTGVTTIVLESGSPSAFTNIITQIPLYTWLWTTTVVYTTKTTSAGGSGSGTASLTGPGSAAATVTGKLGAERWVKGVELGGIVSVGMGFLFGLL